MPERLRAQLLDGFLVWSPACEEDGDERRDGTASTTLKGDPAQAKTAV